MVVTFGQCSFVLIRIGCRRTQGIASVGPRAESFALAICSLWFLDHSGSLYYEWQDGYVVNVILDLFATASVQ